MIHDTCNHISEIVTREVHQGGDLSYRQLMRLFSLALAAYLRLTNALYGSPSKSRRLSAPTHSLPSYVSVCTVLLLSPLTANVFHAIYSLIPHLDRTHVVLSSKQNKTHLFKGLCQRTKCPLWLSNLLQPCLSTRTVSAPCLDFS